MPMDNSVKLVWETEFYSFKVQCSIQSKVNDSPVNYTNLQQGKEANKGK